MISLELPDNVMNLDFDKNYSQIMKNGETENFLKKLIDECEEITQLNEIIFNDEFDILELSFIEIAKKLQ